MIKRKWFQPPKFLVAGTFVGMILDPILHGLKIFDPLWLWVTYWGVIFFSFWILYELFLRLMSTDDDFW